MKLTLKTKYCKHFKEGTCKFPDNECWDKHTKEIENKPSSEKGDKLQCHTCRKSFTIKNEMMIHRIKEHPDKVKPCRDQESCTRKPCWYRHEAPAEVEHTNDNWVNSELDNENVDFQEVTMLPKPALAI